MNILILNAGSSSRKSRLYAIEGDTLPDTPPPPLWSASVDSSKEPGMAQLHVETASGVVIDEAIPETSSSDLLAHMLQMLWSGPAKVVDAPGDIHIVGHRVVHGGRDYRSSTKVTPAVKDAIARLADLAPAHNPANLEGIEVAEQLLGNVPQVAAFDTAFHAHLPDAAAIYPGPFAWVNEDIRRYGFHGISHEYCAGRAAQMLGRDLAALRLITCHLGNGCSLAAVRDGRSVDTTMGFTPLEGLMMGTRSGSIDPGLLLYLLRHKNMSVDELDAMLNKQSGLKGISGLSGDMRHIAEGMARGDARAQLAFDMFVHRVRFHIGAMLPSLGGLDALVFTAGIGQNSAPVRAKVCEAFGFLGLELDAQQNERGEGDRDIATAASKVRVLVIHTEEEWAIARDCWKLARE